MAKAKQKTREVKSTWWQVLSISNLIPGVLYFISNVRAGVVEAIVSLAISLLLSCFIWRQNIVAFRLFRLFILLSFFWIVIGSFNGVFDGEDLSYFGFIEITTILANITLVFSLVALWIQLKKEKKISW